MLSIYSFGGSLLCLFRIIFHLLGFCEQGKYEEAGPLCERSLAIREKALGPGHPAVAESLCNRADLLMDQVG